MKNLIKIALIIPFLVSLSSCSDDFINLTPIDEASSGNSFKSPADANLAVIGIYDALQSNSYAQDMTLLTELITDNTMVQPTRIADVGRGDLRELEFFQLTDNNIYIQSRWSALYTGIARANSLLKRIEEITFPTAALKNQYIGEAKFLRANFYFDLVRLFGGVPVSTTVIDNTEGAFSLKRSSEAEVFNQITSDLLDASTLLPLSYSAAELGRATKGAAKAILAKVYLTNGKADLALPLLREISTAPYTYRLMNTFAEVFDTDNNAESIFEVQYTSTVVGEGNPYPQFFLTNDASAGRDVFGTGYLGTTSQGISLATKDIFDAFIPTDVRRDYSIRSYFSKQENANVFLAFKYRSIPSAAFSSEDNIPLIRFADVVLMLAEAINESGKAPTNEAYDAVDKIRKRANLPVLVRTMDYEGFKNVLLQERRLELAFENHRWLDLKRFKKAEEVLKAKGYAIKPFHLLYPIPRKEVQINPTNITQNPNY